MPKLSIIIATFNSAKTIAACLESIRRQTFSDYEVLIQDGLSTDDTAALTNDFAASHPEMKIRLIQERDQGVYDAMNKAVERASGDWLYFLGSDDELYDEDGFSRMLDDSATAGADVIYGNVRMLKLGAGVEETLIYAGEFNLEKLLHQNICHQAIVYRRNFVRRAGHYNNRYRILADWDFNLRCWALTRFRYVDTVLALFRLGGLSNTHPDEAFTKEIGQNVMQYFGWSLYHPLLNSRFFVGSSRILQLQRSKSIFHFAAGLVYFQLNKVARKLRGA